MGDEDDADDPKAMQFAKMDVPEVYMTNNDEELVLKLEQVCRFCATTSSGTNQFLHTSFTSPPWETLRENAGSADTNAPSHNHALSVLRPLENCVLCSSERAVDDTTTKS